jgi:hypothetical protein
MLAHSAGTKILLNAKKKYRSQVIVWHNY